jgi:flavorubredoxin
VIPATVIFVLALAWILSYLWLNQEVVSQIDVRNPEGKTGTALVVYHPGRGSFHSQVVSSFADGLVSSGWRVEVTTASAQAPPTDLSSYDLLVLGSPTYWFTPSWTIQRFLRRLGDLGGQLSVTIISGMGAGERSASVMEKLVREANGNLVKGLLLYWMRPNDDDNYVNTDQNKALAAELAKQAGKEIPRSQGQA